MFLDMPKSINSVDTSEGWVEKGLKLLITGKVYEIDGKTPAKDVIIYYWQTNNDRYYASKPNMNKDAQRHGHIRGWIKTDRDGKYSIYTIRPAPYPNENIPAHIHISIKEPNLENEYYNLPSLALLHVATFMELTFSSRKRDNNTWSNLHYL